MDVSVFTQAIYCFIILLPLVRAIDKKMEESKLRFETDLETKSEVTQYVGPTHEETKSL